MLFVEKQRSSCLIYKLEKMHGANPQVLLPQAMACTLGIFIRQSSKERSKHL